MQVVQFQRPLTILSSTRHTAKRSSSCRRRAPLVQAYKVAIDVNGRTEHLEVGENQTILEVALEQGLELSHDCKMGVCMTCPAKLVRGHELLNSACYHGNAVLTPVSLWHSRSPARLTNQQVCWMKMYRRRAMHYYVWRSHRVTVRYRQLKRYVGHLFAAFLQSSRLHAFWSVAYSESLRP